eukprot:NODE_3342_length_784_cov_90.065306_g2792_i0.p2 GENE.NODE_3342_length_784_cov_90.065306_g2792_i0~~NODE_3342_length_784_cov_90.065306_g2792_i0.p2  ORF type:complete len:219 (+),score=85.34 NODE_3342_length_784_cov_90.065306_g2792_i0:96-659(+)
MAEYLAFTQSDKEPEHMKYRPIIGVDGIIISFISLLCNPDPGSDEGAPANVDALRMWRESPKKYKEKVAKCVAAAMAALPTDFEPINERPQRPAAVEPEDMLQYVETDSMQDDEDDVSDFDDGSINEEIEEEESIAQIVNELRPLVLPGITDSRLTAVVKEYNAQSGGSIRTPPFDVLIEKGLVQLE